MSYVAPPVLLATSRFLQNYGIGPRLILVTDQVYIYPTMDFWELAEKTWVIIGKI